MMSSVLSNRLHSSDARAKNSRQRVLKPIANRTDQEAAAFADPLVLHRVKLFLPRRIENVEQRSLAPGKQRTASSEQQAALMNGAGQSERAQETHRRVDDQLFPICVLNCRVIVCRSNCSAWAEALWTRADLQESRPSVIGASARICPLHQRPAAQVYTH